MQSLSHYTSANQEDWDEFLPALLFAFCIAPSLTTGESPFYLLYGRKPVLPMKVPLKPPNKVPASIATYRTHFRNYNLLNKLLRNKFSSHNKR